MSRSESQVPSLYELWLGALAADVGIAISTDDRALLTQQLYRERAQQQDIRLEQLVLIQPAERAEVWIVKRDADGEPG